MSGCSDCGPSWRGRAVPLTQSGSQTRVGLISSSWEHQRLWAFKEERAKGGPAGRNLNTVLQERDWLVIDFGGWAKVFVSVQSCCKVLFGHLNKGKLQKGAEFGL